MFAEDCPRLNKQMTEIWHPRGSQIDAVQVKSIFTSMHEQDSEISNILCE